MLHVFASQRRADQIPRLCRRAPEALRGRVRLHSYEWARWLPGIAGGIYLFTNLEALEPVLFERACSLAAAIRSANPAATILNDPQRVMRRYELGRALHGAGINSFDCYRADEGRPPERWPVFLRGEYDHYGAEPELLENTGALESALAEPEFRRKDRARRLIVEFVDTRLGDTSTYRKYSVFRVGERLIAAHIYFGEHWMVKMNRPPSADELAEEEQFVQDNPDADEVLAIFELAGIEYGRIDYSKGESGIEVWEINTNPTITNRHIEQMNSRTHISSAVTDQVARALAALADDGRGQPRIPPGALTPVRGRAWRRAVRHLSG